MKSTRHYWIDFKRADELFTVSVDAMSEGDAMRKASSVIANRRGGSSRVWAHFVVTIKCDDK